MADQFDPDYKDYQDYIEYQRRVSGSTPQNTLSTPSNQGQNMAVLPPEKPIDGSTTQRTQSLMGYKSGLPGENVRNEMALGAGMGPAGNAIGSAALGDVSKFIGPAVQRNKILGMVKNKMEDLGPYISGKINEAKEAFTSSNIAPKMARQAELAEGQSIKINPDNYMGHDPDVDAILQKHLKTTRQSSPYGEYPMEADVPLSDALEIRAKLNKASNFRPGAVYSDEAIARSKAARGAGDTLREQINSTPEVGQEIAKLSDDLQSHYNLRNDVTASAKKTPIQSIIGSSPDKISKLAQFDQQAGTQLGRLGQDVDTSIGRIGSSRSANIIRKTDIPSAIARETIGRGGRAYDASAAALAKIIGSPGTRVGVKAALPIVQSIKSSEEP